MVGQKLNATIGGDVQEQILGLRRSVSNVSQRLQAPKTWLGSEEVNVLQVLCDLLHLVEQMNVQLAGHVHGASPTPHNAQANSLHAVRASNFASVLQGVTAQP
ncbi:conserved hypothetical protein [Pseudomonas entomophila L48]|uniref:Uncharacterized protein n=1 Tax=Pseudomonas entomophila (strain L48) TaxID=384676 RepID=Q1I3D9_PSEE4|nr:conserved hypothetical protein [Pseudomonas entomophila L48]